MTLFSVSHYRVLEQLDAGGMGIVYRARDERLGREVALKFLPPHLSSQPESLQRFRREARVASSLNHPHICTIYDVGEHDGRPYIVMELLEGMTLRDLIAGEPLAAERVVDLAMQIADALAAAHARGVIHRDIKPANVIVGPNDHVKVLDFGVAKLLSAQRAVVASNGADATPSGPTDGVTNSGALLGTLAYMSPEQARGEAIDARSDLFSTGALLYEMATGQRAFPGTVPAVVSDLLLHGAPVSPFELNRDLPADLVAVIDKALEKDRAVRYQGAGELLADLRRVKRTLASGSVSNVPPSWSGGRAPAAHSALRRVARNRVVVLASIGGVLALLGGTIAQLVGGRARPPDERDEILLGDFTNYTAQPVFDYTLRQGLAAQLSQSPFLIIVPDQRVRETLRLMGRAPDDTLRHDVALEVCRRQRVKAMLEGSIATLGRLFVVALDAVNCETGEAIAREQVQVENREDVLRTIGSMASRLRQRLGESLASIQRFDAPIEQVTTPSLEALRAYTLGQRRRARGEEFEAIPFLLRAIEIDPDFASAYNVLSNVYSNLGESERAKRFATLAYQRRQHVSERERLYITYQYDDLVTGNQPRVIQTLELWKQSFPREFQPVNSLAFIYNQLGHFERAIVEGEEAVRRNPWHGFPYSNLALAYRGLGRYDEARRTAQRAVALQIETVPTRQLLYQVAILAGDDAAAARHLAWARGKPREFDLIAARAQVAAHAGRVSEARRLYGEVVRMAELANLPEAASGYLARATWMDLAFGDTTSASAGARRVLARHSGYEPDLAAALTLAVTGAPDEAERIARALARANPDHTMVTAVLVPIVRGGAALGRRRHAEALDHLQAAALYERGVVAALAPIYLRGQAFLMAGAGPQAAAEFQRLLEHRGTDPFSPFHAVAPLGLARARAMAGDSAGSRRAYEQFLAGWRQADPDVPVLLAARAELQRLPPAGRPSPWP